MKFTLALKKKSNSSLKSTAGIESLIRKTIRDKKKRRANYERYEIEVQNNLVSVPCFSFFLFLKLFSLFLRKNSILSTLYLQKNTHFSVYSVPSPKTVYCQCFFWPA